MADQGGDTTVAGTKEASVLIVEVLKRGMEPIKRRLVGLFDELWPPTLFFFVAFLLMAVMFKLLVQQFAVVEFSAFAKAAVFALILAKVMALVDWAESGYRPDSTHRRIVVVGIKTVVYALAVIVFGIGEKTFETYRKADSFADAVAKLIADANIDRFMGLVLVISVVVFIYLAMQEIENAMGKGALFRLFFKLPAPGVMQRGPSAHLERG